MEKGLAFNYLNESCQIYLHKMPEAKQPANLLLLLSMKISQNLRQRNEEKRIHIPF